MRTSLACWLAVLTTVAQASELRLDLAADGCRAAVWLNGQPWDGAAPTQPGLYLVAVEAAPLAGAGRLAPVLHLGERSWPAETGWHLTTGPVDDDWRTRLSTAGWQTVRQPTIAVTGPTRLRKAVWIRPDDTVFFPKQTAAWLPAGSSNLVRPYVDLPPEVPAEGVRLRLTSPSQIAYVTADTAVGLPVTSGQSRPTATGAEHQLDLGIIHGSGFELSLRWGDASGSTLAYQGAIRDGGTFDWRRREVTVTAPVGAVSVSPLVIKWQNRGITGTFWVDNISLRRVGEDRELIDCGTFDEPGWGERFKAAAGQGVDGSNCFKVVATEDNVRRQQALWVRLDDGTIPVEPGAEYVLSLDLRCEGLSATGGRPNVAALFAVEPTAPPGEYPCEVGLELLDGAVVSPPTVSRLVVLPPLRDVRPARSRIAPCYYGDIFTAPAVQEAYAENLWASGMTWTYGLVGNAVAQRLLPRGLGVFLSLHWTPWQAPKGMTTRVADDPSIQAVEFSGKRSTHTICPTWLLANYGEVRPHLAAQITSQLAGQGYRGANWDLEQPVLDPPTFCVCDRCLTAFAAKLGQPGQAVAVESLTGEHRAAWVAFRLEQNATMAGHLRELVKAAEPGIEFSLYSGFKNLRTRERYGVDWDLMSAHLDLGIAGYGGTSQDNLETLAALGRGRLMGGQMHYLSPTSDERPGPDPLTWRNRLLWSYLISGRVGVLIWYLPTMDGAAFYSTSEAAELIAAEEAWLEQAEPAGYEVGSGDRNQLRVFRFRLGEETRAYLLNMGGSGFELPLTEVGGGLAGRVRQAVGGRLADGRISLEPHGYLVLE